VPSAARRRAASSLCAASANSSTPACYAETPMRAFSKVFSIVTFYCERTRTLTFENFIRYLARPTSPSTKPQQFRQSVRLEHRRQARTPPPRLHAPRFRAPHLAPTQALHLLHPRPHPPLRRAASCPAAGTHAVRMAGSSPARFHLVLSYTSRSLHRGSLAWSPPPLTPRRIRGALGHLQ
jgi:hypothetical protein